MSQDDSARCSTDLSSVLVRHLHSHRDRTMQQTLERGVSTLRGAKDFTGYVDKVQREAAVMAPSLGSNARGTVYKSLADRMAMKLLIA